MVRRVRRFLVQGGCKLRREVASPVDPANQCLPAKYSKDCKGRMPGWPGYSHANGCAKLGETAAVGIATAIDGAT